MPCKTEFLSHYSNISTFVHLFDSIKSIDDISVVHTVSTLLVEFQQGHKNYVKVMYSDLMLVFIPDHALSEFKFNN